jgi:mRNA-degrading endonuclease RelE of RelBE toxin-antitoxin system
MAREAYQWYEAQREGLGDLFLAALDNGLKNIQSTPTANAKVKKNYRQGRVHRFPYVIVYEIIRSEIVVLSVFHTRRSPRQKFT